MRFGDKQSKTTVYTDYTYIFIVQYRVIFYFHLHVSKTDRYTMVLKSQLKNFAVSTVNSNKNVGLIFILFKTIKDKYFISKVTSCVR